MQEVLKKIDDLHSLLEKKVEATEVLNGQLSRAKLQAEKDNAILIAKNNNLKAKERIYAKYDDFEGEKKKFSTKKKNYDAKIKDIDKNEAEISKKKSDLDKIEKELDKRKVSLNQQAIALKEREDKFKKDREELKSFVSGDKLKSIFK